MNSVKLCKIEPLLVNAPFQKSELALVKEEPTTNGELLSLDNFLTDKIKKEYNSEWEYSNTCCPKDYSHLDHGQDLEISYMRGCVTSPYDAAGGGQSILDTTVRIIESGQFDSNFDTLECYSFLWDMFKEDDASSSPTSETVTVTTTPASASSSDEEVISSSSSTMLYYERPSSESPPPSTMKRKATVNSPPDDVRAFFGHPLTRAANALNGKEVDANADVEALLHEYKHLQSMDKDEAKVTEKIGFLDIVRGQQSDPSLSTTRPEISSSLSSEHPPSPDTGHDEIGHFEQEAVEDSAQQADEMTAYVNMFLQDNIQLDDILGTPSEEQTDSNTVDEVSETLKQQGLRKRKSPRRGVGSTLQRRGPKGEVKRATRKSRTRSDAVTSTTNSLSRRINSRTMSENVSGAVFQQSAEVGLFSGPGHQFHPEGAVVTSTDVTTVLPDVVASAPAIACSSVLLAEGHIVTTSNSAGPVTLTNNKSTVVVEHEADHRNNLPSSEIKQRQDPTQVLTLAATTVSSNNSGGVHPCSSTSQLLTVATSSATLPSVSAVNVTPASINANAPFIKTNSQNISHDSLVKENNNLKRALSEKIRSRRSTEESLILMPSQTIRFADDVSDMGLETKFSPMATIKQEDQYLESFDHQYQYSSELANSVASLTNCSALPMTSSASDFQNLLPVTMAMCEEAMTATDSNNNAFTRMTPSSLHHISNSSIDHLSFPQHRHQHHLPHQQQLCHLSHTNSSQVTEDAMVVQSSQGQYFQVLQPLQQIESHPHVTSTDCNNAATSYYNHMYHSSPNTQLLDTNKQMVVERYLHQQYAYGSGYTHFLNPDNNYNMKSPDSGFHEPCTSPSSSSMTLKEGTTSQHVNGTKEKPKKKKPASGGGLLLRQYSSSGMEKAASRSPAIQKLDVNNTGYSYFLETPISTTQRKDEDRVTYLNKSQYYGLSLEFNSQERVIKCAVVKSVIILAFREEKIMEEERKAWEFWHGRQHSYKQRILDIDTKNCQGVLPQNIEELSFNAVAVKWNPMEGPVRVNIAVHCLSTDFSNQKGVKGVPLHIQIDTYEQSPKENHLVHRGYCQIKAFCDKGAERKTRDEERRKAAKGKPDDFGNAPVSNKSRKKVDEAFHEPHERSEFYSMANTTTPPVFFNPLYENTEFIHKSITVGVVPTQDDEISSLPNKLELPDSCGDYYTNSPAKRPRTDSGSNLKDQKKVLLYIRERHETAYTALMLEVPTLHGLLRSIELKYSIAPSKVKNFYKKSRKGILVKLDDNIVRHYSHEATFIIETNVLNENGDYEIILIEIDPVSS